MKLSAGEIIVGAGSIGIIAFAAIVGTVIYLKPPPVRFAYEQTPQTVQGEAVYRREGCSSCHEIFGNGASYGPTLDGVGSNRSADWLERYLMSPWPEVSAKPYRLKMPPYDHLTQIDMAALIAYLSALKRSPQEN